MLEITRCCCWARPARAKTPLGELVEHYAELGVTLETINVTATMGPEAVWRMLRRPVGEE